MPRGLRGLGKLCVLGVMGSGGGLGYAPTITPTLGVETLTNGDFESWSSPTNANWWGEEKGGTSSVNQESVVVHGGLYACRLDVDGSNSAVDVKTENYTQVNSFLRVTGWVRSSQAGKTASINGTSNDFIRSYDPGANWVQFILTGQITGVGPFYLNRGSAASASLYYDDVSAKIITPASMVATPRRSVTGDCTVRVRVSVPIGRQGGLMANMGNAASPFTDGVLVMFNRSSLAAGRDAVQVAKFANGTRTPIFNVATTYIDNAELKFVRSGNTCKIYYNDVQVGGDQTISDATIVNNTLHMQFASDPEVRFSFFTVAGSESEYPVMLPQNLNNGLGYRPAVAIMFDDADGSVYANAFPYLQSKGMVATVYVITSLINTTGYMTDAQLLELQAAGWTVGNHSQNHNQLDTLTEAQQEAELSGGAADLAAFGITGNDPCHVAYPGGTYNADTLTAMSNTGMLTGRPMASGLYNLPFASRFEIKGMQVLNTTTLATTKSNLDAAVTARQVRDDVFHRVSDGGTAYEWPIASFQGYCDYIDSIGLQTLSMDELYRLQSGPITVTHR